MKKIFAMILISLTLLASCAEIDDNKNAGGTSTPDTTEAETTVPETHPMFPGAYISQDTKLADYLILGDCAPYEIPNTNKEFQSPVEFDYMVVLDEADGADKLYDAIVSRKLDLKIKSKVYWVSFYNTILESELQCNKACLVDKENAEAYKAYFEALTSADYKKYYSDDFFDKNILLFTDISEGYWPELCMFEYSFDPQTKTLSVNARHINSEGWEHCRHQSGHNYYGSIVIPKEDITIDGKIVPLEELNVEFTGIFIY